MAPLGSEVSTAIKLPVSLPEETMAEPLHTWLKAIFGSNCYLDVLEKTVNVIG